jgi:hypothetical protein
LRSARTIYHAVVARKGEHHHRLNSWLTINGHNPLSYTPYSQDSSLRLINDGVESINVVHTQIADRESAAAYILWAEFPGLRFCHQFHPLPGEFTQAERIRLVDNRNNQSLFNSHS